MVQLTQGSIEEQTLDVEMNNMFNAIYDDEDTFHDGDEFEGELNFDHYK